MALSTMLFIFREPGCVPQYKRCVAGSEMKFLRELMDARPNAFITLVQTGENGPLVWDGPEYMQIMDGRQRHRARRHRESTRAAFAAGK